MAFAGAGEEGQVCGRRRAAAGLVVLLLAALLPPARAPAGGPAIDAMPRIALEAGGRVFEARLAGRSDLRAAGFQHVPAARMDREAIYFAYERPVRPSYHMRNVARSLLLAWIGTDGRVRRVIRMAPGSTGHEPDRPVTAVLEYTAAHPLAAHLRPGMRVTPTGHGTADGGVPGRP